MGKLQSYISEVKMGHKVKQSLANSRIDFFYYAFRNILLVSLPILVISTLLLSSFHSSAVTSGASADSLTLSLPTSCTLSSVVNSAHNATLNSGTYTSDIGKTTITTLCNDGNGYAIYANGLSNGIVGNNTLISSVSSNHNIATGIYEQGDTTSSWAMKLGNVSGDTSPTPPVIEQDYNNTYGLVPSTWIKVAGRQSGTTDMITGSTFTTTYAVYTAPTQHAGTYTGQVAYVLIHGSGDSIGTLHLMQNVSEWQNEIPNQGDTLQAMDTRDGKQYWVTRLADGHIWMTQNLDFDIEANTTLNSQTTDLNVSYDASTNNYREYQNGYTENNGVIYWKPASTATTIDFTGGNSTVVPGWTKSGVMPASASRTDDINIGHASLGNYYNWTAAIASNNSSSLTGNTFNNVTNNPKNSICPKGWRLPTISNQGASTIGSTNEFARLNQLYNAGTTNTDTGLISDPLYFVTSGEINADGKASSIGYSGNYLSSSFNGSSAGFLKLTATQVIPNGSYGKGYGWSIRCIAK